jgi:hypothetical protein
MAIIKVVPYRSKHGNIRNKKKYETGHKKVHVVRSDTKILNFHERTEMDTVHFELLM